MSTNRARRPGPPAGQAAQPRQPRQAAQSRQPRQAAQFRQPRQRRARPLPPGDTLFSPGASAARSSIEQRSATPLLWLHQLPAWLLPVVAVALLVMGLTVGGWGGAIALVAVAAALGWLAALSWPRLSGRGRMLRLAAVTAILAIAVLRALH